MDRLIKKARNAKEEALRRKQEAARKAAEAAEKQAEEEAQIDEEPIETVTVEGDGLGQLQPSAPGAVLPSDGNTVTQGIGGAATRVSAEASAASRQKYIEGLDAFNQDDYERAREAWIVAKQLDPGNTDADMGLRKVEELTGIR